MYPLARFGDPLTHDKVVSSGVIGPPVGPPAKVLIEGLPAACMGDLATCSGLTQVGPAHPPQAGPAPAVPPSTPILTGSPFVVIGGRPAARWTADATGCGVVLGDEKLLPLRKVFCG